MFQSLFILAQPNNAIIGELIRTKVGMISNILGGLFGGNRNRMPRGYYPQGYYPHRYLSDNDLDDPKWEAAFDPDFLNAESNGNQLEPAINPFAINPYPINPFGFEGKYPLNLRPIHIEGMRLVAIPPSSD